MEFGIGDRCCCRRRRRRLLLRLRSDAGVMGVDDRMIVKWRRIDTLDQRKGEKGRVGIVGGGSKKFVGDDVAVVGVVEAVLEQVSWSARGWLSVDDIDSSKLDLVVVVQLSSACSRFPAACASSEALAD